MKETRPKVYKPDEKQRLGRGFSRGELKKAETSVAEALRLAISLDSKRKTLHEENVAAVTALLKLKRKPPSRAKPKRKSKS